ncbi:MAG TPA: flavodoxin [Candidatus Avidesulfovibrio excrementigallinarum]|nr:flavodoxin [Candidatus Avidesulfovibrio excrementigallinarum]
MDAQQHNKQPRVAVVYASVTGNTRLVAAALAESTGDPLLSVKELADPAAFDVLALGFWVRRGQPDPASQALWRRIQGRLTFWFGTLGAWPWSEHADKCRQAATALLAGGGNTVLGGFLCQGRVSVPASSKHPMTPERMARLAEAAHHPDAQDLAAAAQAWMAARETALRRLQACPDGRCGKTL